MTSPLLLRYEGEGRFQAPTDYWAGKADAEFDAGGTYRIVELQERSQATHNHFFAAVAEAWASIPDELLPEYPLPEALRKKMLIRCGFADERTFVCTSKAEAQRLAAFIRPIDNYAIVTVRDNVVKHFTAQSQSYRAMGKEIFAESKAKVLEAIHALLERKVA